MANITASDVKELREMTGCGMMDCKRALVEADGNRDEAVKILREKGLAKAAKKAGRIAAEAERKERLIHRCHHNIRRNIRKVGNQIKFISL